MTRRQAAAALTAALVVLVTGRAASAELNAEDYDAIQVQLSPQTAWKPVVVAIPPNTGSQP